MILHKQRNDGLTSRPFRYGSEVLVTKSFVTLKREQACWQPKYGRAYRFALVVEKDGSETTINTPGDFPNPSELLNRRITAVLEPMIRATIIAPDDYTGPIMQLCAVRPIDIGIWRYKFTDDHASRITEANRFPSPTWTTQTIPRSHALV